MDYETELKKQINNSQKIQKMIQTILSDFEYYSSLKNNISVAYFDLSMEYHQSIVLLINNSIFGSAFSLVRPLYEAYMRFLFLQTLSNEEEINEIKNDKFKFPKMEKMVEIIDEKYNTSNFFKELKVDSWKHMNSYTHNGMLQLGRRFTDEKMQPNYSYEERIDVLKNIDTLIILFGIAFFKSMDGDKKAKLLEEILENY